MIPSLHQSRMGFPPLGISTAKSLLLLLRKEQGLLGERANGQVGLLHFFLQCG